MTVLPEVMLYDVAPALTQLPPESYEPLPDDVGSAAVAVLHMPPPASPIARKTSVFDIVTGL